MSELREDNTAPHDSHPEAIRSLNFHAGDKHSTTTGTLGTLAARHHRYSYLTPKAEVRRSPLHGYGLFATAPIARHAVVAIWGGPLLTDAESLALPAAVQQYHVQVWVDLFVGPRSAEEVEPVYLVNHSCEPTCGVHGSHILVARRDIRVGEELTFDYGTTETTPLRMRCSCGSPSCRGLITGDEWRDPAFRTRHASYLSLYICELAQSAALT